MPSSPWLRSLTARMVAASCVLALGISLAFTVLLNALSDLGHSSRWVEHSVQVLAASSELQNSVGDLGTVTRDYATTGQRQAYARWQSTRARIFTQTRQLEGLVADNPAQELAARSIGAAARSFAVDWSGPLVSLEYEGRHAAAQRLLAGNQGRERQTEMRAQFERFNEGEKSLGTRRARAARAHGDTAKVIAGLSFAGLVLVSFVLAALLSRVIVMPVRRLALAARRLAGGELVVQVPESGRNEVGELAHAFNFLSNSVRESRQSLEAQNSELEAQQEALEGALSGIADQKNRVEGLHRFGEALARETDLDALANIVLGELRSFLAAEVGTLYSVDGEHMVEMTCLSAHGVDIQLLPEEILPGEGLAGRAIVERRMITASFGDGGLRMDTGDGELLLAREVHVPLVQGDQPVGVATLGTTRREQLGERQVEQLAYLAGQAAVALSNAIALRRARAQAAINRAVLENAREAFVAFEPSGRITGWNPEAERVFGYAGHEVLGHDLFEIVIAEGERDAFRSALHEGPIKDRLELTLMRRDGSEFPAALTMSALELGGDRVFNAFLHDVTHAKRAELYARTQFDVSSVLAKGGALEAAAPDVLAAVAGNLGWPLGTFWAVADDGSALERQAVWAAPDLGLVEHEVSGRLLAERAVRSGELLLDPYAGTAEEREAAALAGLVHAVALPLVADGGVVGAMTFYGATAPDPGDEQLSSALSEIGLQVGQYLARKRAQNAADRMKDGFLALVSHELRTPLTSIVGYLELLVEDEGEEVSEHGRQFLAVIDRNARRLQRLVDDVLFAAQAEAGRLSLNPGRVDLARVAAESVEAARPTAVERTIDLRLDAGRLPHLWADRDRMGQALDNLISNALKFTPPGGRVDVRLRPREGWVAIEVTDTGLGMSEKDRARVFDRFFRAGATRDSAPGVGLGLTIVKAIAEGHGGTIGVTSREGVGTTFRIDLPARNGASPSYSSGSSASSSSSGSAASGRVKSPSS